MAPPALPSCPVPCFLFWGEGLPLHSAHPKKDADSSHGKPLGMPRCRRTRNSAAGSKMAARTGRWSTATRVFQFLDAPSPKMFRQLFLFWTGVPSMSVMQAPKVQRPVAPFWFQTKSILRSLWPADIWVFRCDFSTPAGLACNNKRSRD